MVAVTRSTFPTALTILPMRMLIGKSFAYGIVGLRVLPNPNFDDGAKRWWDAQPY
jgi:hypothetical protein